MSPPLWVTELAAAFWAGAGGPEPFPRTLAGAIARSPFDLTVKELPGLTVGRAERYLAGLGVAWACGEPDRPLRACLAAKVGAGFVFLDPDDEPGECVFSLAHELAHFLRHYLQPRRLARRRLGPGAEEVLDGRRPATHAERLRALLANVPVGCHSHRMVRGADRRAPGAEVARTEEEADRLAFELLAPAAAVLRRTRPVGDRGGGERLVAVLREGFGLSADRAAEYGRLLVPRRPEDPLLSRLQ
jgi:hypothetical protein